MTLQPAPLDAELQEAYVLTDIGPRVAVCCGLHALAARAGLVPEGPEGDMDTAADESSWRQAAGAAGVDLWRRWLQVPGHGWVHAAVLCISVMTATPPVM